MNKIALGTVQFGCNYGILNVSGKTAFLEARKIIKLAKKSSIDLVDTAISYGDSEKTLGKIGILDFKIVSKLPPLLNYNQNINSIIEEMVEGILQRLKIKSLYGLLLHRPKDIIGTNGTKIIEALSSLKKNGKINKIGISIYDPSEIQEVIDILNIDIIQCPLNVIDRRIEKSGWLKKLQSKNIEIHTRSTFLQGLLIAQENKIPHKFKRWSHLFDRWFLKLKKSNLNPIHACLSYPLSLPEIDRVIIGVENVNQLETIINFTKADILTNDFSFMISNDKLLINPNNW